MIRITDMTLSCLDAFHPTDRQLCELFALLRSTGVDRIEMPAEFYKRIRPSTPEIVTLRIDEPEEAVHYPEINRFISRRRALIPNEAVFLELRINDRKEISLLGRCGVLQNIRVVSLDDLLCYDYESTFRDLKKQVKGRVEVWPEDGYSCGTAAAVEWVMNGGVDVVASFGGIGCKASLEELLLALRVVKRYRPGASYAMFPEIAALVEKITSTPFPDKKAIIGREIFDVESGIHIDGILKKPEMYEPFLPELVGGRRRFVVGKHSGKKALRVKLAQLGLDPEEYDSGGLLQEVRTVSTEEKSSLSDEEFLKLAERHRK